MKTSTKAHLAVLGANLLFGINFSMVKALTPGIMAPFAVNGVRIAGSVALFWLLYLTKPSRAGIDRQDLPRFFLCAISGVAINQLLFISGLSLTSSIHASLLTLGTPIFITAAAAWLLHEKFTTNKLFGLLLGIAGALVLVAGRSAGKNGNNMLLGDVMIIINSISYSLYFVWVRPLMEKYSAIHVIRWVFTLGAIFILPFGVADLYRTSFGNFSPLAWMAMIFVVVGGTFLPYIFNMFGIKLLGPGITGNYIYTQPFFAALIGVLFLNEHFGWQQILSCLLIVSGVLLVNKRKVIKA